MLNPAKNKSALAAVFSTGGRGDQTANQDDKKAEGLHRLSASILIRVKQRAAPVMAPQLPEEASQADNQDSNSRLLPLVSSALIQVNQHTTLTAFRNQQTTRNRVSKCGQGIGPGDSQFALSPQHDAQSNFHVVSSENIFFKRK